MSSRLPTVVTDDYAVGRRAAGFFLDRGYRHFAYLAHGHQWDFSDQRGEGFIEAILAADLAGSTTVSWFGPHGGRLPNSVRRFRGTPTAWAASLPKPVALFTSNDGFGAGFRDLAEASGLLVPMHVSIVGTDDDPLFHSGNVGISSIALPTQQIGRAAAELLDRMLRGEHLTGHRQYLPPGPLTVRSSSDCMPIDDAEVLEAMAHIRRRKGKGVTVADLLDMVPVGRRTLERRFAAVLGTSPLKEIRRARTNHARQLLATTHMSVQEVALAVGCRNQSHLSVDFKAITGLSPREYRKRNAPPPMPTRA